MNTEPFSGFETAKNYVEEGFLWVTALCEEEFHEPKFDASIQSGEVLLKHQRPTQARTIIEESTNLKDWNPVQTNMPAQLPLKVNTSGTGERLFFRSVSTLP